MIQQSRNRYFNKVTVRHIARPVSKGQTGGFQYEMHALRIKAQPGYIETFDELQNLTHRERARAWWTHAAYDASVISGANRRP